MRFLIGRVDERRGRTDEARRAFEAVVAATPTGNRAARRLDLLTIPALRALGRGKEATSRASTVAAAAPAELQELAEALARGALAADYVQRAGDIESRLLMRALSLPDR